MKVDHIETCICIDHEPTAADSVFYGMPQLKVTGSGGNEWYTPYCPNCGRGGCSEHKSAYLALKHWNNMQIRLKSFEKRGLFELDNKIGEQNEI